MFYFDGETALAACVLRATTKKGRQLFLSKKVHHGYLTGVFSDLEMTWLLYCAGAATGVLFSPVHSISFLLFLSSLSAFPLPFLSSASKWSLKSSEGIWAALLVKRNI